MFTSSLDPAYTMRPGVSRLARRTGYRSLKECGITLAPRLTVFYQGMAAGKGDHEFETGSKLDLLFGADLSKFGLWRGLSVVVHTEYNVGQSLNGRGGTLIPVNTAMDFPGMDGSDAFDLSSVYFQQKFGDSVSVVVGKINMIDIAASKPFMGGAGIDSFWNTTFTAPPSGTVPPYLFGVLLSARTDQATFGLWIYDPVSVVNQTGFEQPFADGVTIRGSVDFPVTIASLSGHQGVVGLYSTQHGTNFDSLDDMVHMPGPRRPTKVDPFSGNISLPGTRSRTVGVKEQRYYFAYVFDQYLYQSKTNPEEGFGLFGQFGISDGNPNGLYWSAFIGIGGMGLIPGRSEDNWGLGVYYDALSGDLKDPLSPLQILRDEQGFELFYNAAVIPQLRVGPDVQIINPSMASETAVFLGLRMVLKF